MGTFLRFLCVLVTPVLRGQVLGKTGAMPGTPGAGVRTTGPHLHFEVWQDGVRVDPLLPPS